ncbi:MAG: PDZ domain-containing protein, partial [Myxococcales bacterium]|nr:PDZ domain-containing protein [Myxococcales bacterium]
SDQGALVRFVMPGGPADKAGLRNDDVILKFEGETVQGPEKLRWLASLAGVGKTVKLEVMRGKRKMELSVMLGELPDQPSAAAPDAEEEEPDSPFGPP